MSTYFSDSQSQSLSTPLIQYPHIEFTDKSVLQNPPSVALDTATATISESAAAEGQAQVPSVKCSYENNYNNDVIIRTQFLIPTRNKKDDCINYSYDESYFPAELCINWNMIQAARMDSCPVSDTHSRAADTYNVPVFVGSQGFCAPKSDMSFVEFVRESPKRAMAYTTFVASLQQNFSQQVRNLTSVTRGRCVGVFLLFLLGGSFFTIGITLLSANLSCKAAQNDEQNSSQNGDEQTDSEANCSSDLGTLILGVVLIVIGLMVVLRAAVIACQQKRLFLEELEKKSASLTLCGQGGHESANSQTLSVPCGRQQPQPQQQKQQQQQQQQRAWHAEVSFEAGAETFSVSANFTISWKACNEQCAQHRACGPLVEVLVNRSTHSDGDSDSHSSAGPQVQSQL